MTAVYVIAALLIAASILSTTSALIIKQYERVVLLELGKVKGQACGPGSTSAPTKPAVHHSTFAEGESHPAEHAE